MMVRATKDCEHRGPRDKGSVFEYQGDPSKLPPWMVPASDVAEPEPEQPVMSGPMKMGKAAAGKKRKNILPPDGGLPPEE